MKYPRQKPRQAGATSAALRHLFKTSFAAQLLPSGGDPDVRAADGYATVWLPDAGLAITSMESSSPVSGLERARAAEMLGIDILIMDLSRHGDLIGCELDLYATRRTHKFSVDRLALWLSTDGVPSLVPYRPRNEYVPMPPCFGLTAAGVALIDDPFADNVAWLAGIARATDAANVALAVQKRATAQAAK